LHLHPTNGQALFGRAKTLYQLGKIDASIKAFALAKRTAPEVGDTVSALLQADALQQRKKYAESLIAYNWALDLNSGSDPNVYSAKSDVLYKLKRYEEAISVCEQAIRLDPYNAVAYDHKGNTLEKLERYEEAISAYEQAIRLDPNNAITHYNKGQALLALHRYEEAIAAYDQAIHLDTNTDTYAYVQKGVSLIQLGRDEEAISAWDQGISYAPVDHANILKELKAAVLKRLNKQSGE
jgi:tetratricopeptide (TPR) repeat protein